jgi:ribonuclease P protein subunit POP4
MITSQNVIHHEIIGLEAKIIHCSEETLIGVAGKVIDETRRTITLQRRDRRLTVPKSNITLQIHLPNSEQVELQGKILLARPEDRIKTRARRSV